jgi:proteasome lid subunit RPN8/RPN11
MNELRLTESLYQQIRAHGERTYPDECCGVLLGRQAPEGWRVLAVVPAENTRTDSARTRYEIAPLALARIDRQALAAGMEIAGFYHSHPDHPAHWSPTDLAEAHWLGCCYLITEVAAGKAAATESFMLAGETEQTKHFVRQQIQIEHPDAGRPA